MGADAGKKLQGKHRGNCQIDWQFFGFTKLK
jgi:hypothetical protein